MAAPPRVVFVNRRYPPDETATSQLLGDLAEHLAARGFRVGVVCSAFGAPPGGDVANGVAVKRLAAGASEGQGLFRRAATSLGFHIAAAWSVLIQARRGDVVVAMTDPPLLGVSIGIAARLRGARTVNWLQDVFPETAAALGVKAAAGPLGRLLARLRDRSLATSAANVAIGSRMAARLATAGGGWVEIPNWALDQPGDPPASEESRLRRRVGLAGRFVVGYSGNLGRAHEFGTLLDAATRLRERLDIAFLIVGGGYHRPGLETAVKTAGLASFTFLPAQPKAALGDSLAAADVHLVSLRPDLEGLVVPSKFYGAAAAARPVLFIGDPQGEVGALCGIHGCGIAVPEGDGAGLAAAILRLAADPALSRSMGAGGLALVRGPASRSAALAAWEGLLVRLGAGPR